MKRTSRNGDEKTVMSLLDVLGSCLVDIFYNHMYDRAIAVHEKTSRGLTECYRQSIQNYMSESKDSHFYRVLLNSLHHYVRMSTIYTDISYTKCIEVYASLFVPQMYSNSLTTDQRVNLLSMVLKNTVHTLVNEIMQQHIGCIIDDHSDVTNIEILQDVVLRVLILQRESSYDRFIQAQKKNCSKMETKPSKATKATKATFLEGQAMARLNAALKKFVAERSILKKKNATLMAQNTTLVNQFNNIKTMFLKQIQMHKDEVNLISQLKSKLQHLEQQSRASTQSRTSAKSDAAKVNEEDTGSDFDDELFSVQYIED